MEYLVVVEKGKSSFGAYVPDLPRCVAGGGPASSRTELQEWSGKGTRRL